MPFDVTQPLSDSPYLSTMNPETQTINSSSPPGTPQVSVSTADGSQMNVKDAFNYLDDVKQHFPATSYEYKEFLAIMNDFKRAAYVPL